ncbi:4a-hydroxytetrahydrobiopterin dehydratase [Actinotalea ferrariae]|uniref:VOC family protein n=1 Tax=Actinotalea ferrariae TaxID=1386098 RepID=UPI001C8B1AFF|nr:VOC family protein [Actinotalea ferrariae]MBX9243771.1 4a-hydroxytetrahydrobiopterin dehydratase [Actinotalea ferrariae]
MATLRDVTVTEQVDARHWRVVLGHLEATFRTGSFARGLELVQRVGAAAEELDHHPDVVLRYPTVLVRTVSHDVGGLTERDVRLAAAVSAIADALGVEPDVAAPQTTEIAIDALDIPSVVPFWRAVLAYEDERIDAEDPSPALVDPRGVGPSVWFQQMDEPRPQRNRIHLDVTVPHDAAEARVAAALAAGGRLVSDLRAPAFWVLADAEGNEACVCTWQARD